MFIVESIGILETCWDVISVDVNGKDKIDRQQLFVGVHNIAMRLACLFLGP